MKWNSIRKLHQIEYFFFGQHRTLISCLSAYFDELCCHLKRTTFGNNNVFSLFRMCIFHAMWVQKVEHRIFAFNQIIVRVFQLNIFKMQIFRKVYSYQFFSYSRNWSISKNVLNKIDFFSCHMTITIFFRFLYSKSI